MSKVTQIRQRARNYLQKGKFDKAIEEYKRLTGMETKNPNYLNELGDIYLKAGDSIQAVSNFEKAVVNYEKVALYNNAVAVCKKILRIIPDRGETIYKLGELRAKQKLSGEANVYFSQYLDCILANADSAGPELNEKINGILELIPGNAEILCKAGDAMVLIGIKKGALELYSKLSYDAEKAGEGDQAAAYKAKIDLLKNSMTKDEIEIVENALSCSSGDETSKSAQSDESQPPAADDGSSVVEAEEGLPPQDAGTESGDEENIEEAAPPATGEDSVEEAAPPATGEDFVEEAAPPATGEDSVEEAATPPESDDGSHDETGEEKIYSVDEVDSDAGPEIVPAAQEEEPDLPDEENAAAGKMEEPANRDVEEEVTTGPDATAGDDEGRIKGEAVEGIDADESAPEGTAEVETPVDDGISGLQGDLSGLLDDARNTDTAENLVEEITSDVEEDDFRSHYDVGMAYLEMALYTEAIKEFQIASRSEQIQIKSIEMIGHCFLMQNNPRLAVKQLLRGLEIVKVANSDNLGVHYNLGLAYEMLGDMEKAREHYEEVYIVDISFRDIAEKMKKLSTVS